MPFKNFLKPVFFLLLIITIIVFMLLLKNNATVGERVPSLPEAIKLAKRYTPLISVENTDITLPGPRKRVLYGFDKNGKKLVVWVRNGNEPPNFVYLEQGITEIKAREILEARGVPKSAIRSLVLDFRATSENAKEREKITEVYWSAYVTNEEKHEVYFIDFYSGKILESKTIK